MTSKLQLMRVPATVMALLAGEACRHHRSVEQEVLALLEEALMARVQARHPGGAEVDEILQRFDLDFSKTDVLDAMQMLGYTFDAKHAPVA